MEENKDYLKMFKELPHLTTWVRDPKIVEVNDWGYSPNLYHFDGAWHVSWIHCSEGDSILDFEGNTPEEVIDKAYEWWKEYRR